MPSVLWWGRSDPEYSRNRILLKSFSDLGWRVDCYRPFSSPFGLMEVYFHRLNRPSLIWVPCFRHTDISSASHWAKKWKVPLVIDPLISAFEKEVFEKNRYAADSKSGKKRRQWESDLFSKADVVVADTPAHAAFFESELRVAPARLCVLYVGAETTLFEPLPAPPAEEPFEILFYGSFLKLQGVDVIIGAAERTQNLPIHWVLLGDGDLRDACERRARGLYNVRFEPWIDYGKLPARMASAHILLGIFGTSFKADLVIPNKLFQAMAAARPVITRRSKAYERTLEGSDVIGWVPAGDAEALAKVVKTWLKNPSDLSHRGKQTRKLYDTYFGREKLRQMLKKVLDNALHFMQPG
jgi:glycosyltransferase involved in cell wall biosynthesis